MKSSLSLIHPLIAASFLTGVPLPLGAGNLPDPRPRLPQGLHELQNMVKMLAAKNGIRVPFTLVEHSDPFFPVARYRQTPTGYLIVVNPKAAREIPPNTWAFIIGHEMAHGVDGRLRTPSGGTHPGIEWLADEVGARFALQAGFCLDAHAGWVFARPDRSSSTHGSDHGRARNLIHKFGADRQSVQYWQQRYRYPLR